MAKSQNNLLKGSITFAVIAIGAALLIVGPDDGENDDAQLAGAEAGETALGASPQLAVNDEDADLDDEAFDYDEEELVEDEGDLGWGEDELLDDTAGFDPTPPDAVDGNDSSGSSFANNDDADVYVEIDNPEGPSTGQRVPTNLVPR